MKKIAVLIYPHFSMQEISCLTDALAIWFDQKIDVFASSKEIMVSEDNFQCIANKTLDEFDVEAYSCIILPGIIDPMDALFDESIISFLRGLKDTDILIAAISSAPMLLAKAGLLDHVHFTSGIWQEVAERLDFIPHQNILHKPLVIEQRFITAIGYAFREFAAAVIEALGLDDHAYDIFKPADLNKTEPLHYMGEENYQEFLTEYRSYVKNTQA